MRKLSYSLVLAALTLTSATFATASESTSNRNLTVTATAYNFLYSRNSSKPRLTAWGMPLKPGLKAIAVSPDLLKHYGLKHKDKVRISGFEGEYLVYDKMHQRKRKTIDIFMGGDRKQALRFGRRKVSISW